MNQTDAQSKKNFKTPEAPLSAYDPFSEKGLKAATWWVVNKEKLRSTLIAVLLVLGVASWGYVLWGVGSFLFFGLNEFKEIGIGLTKSDISYEEFKKRNLPSPLKVAQVVALPTTDRRFDFLSRVQNTNPRWWLEFDYHFLYGSESSPSAHAFVLPSSEKYIGVFGVSTQGSPGGVQMIIDRVAWHHISNKEIPDIGQYRDARLRFTTEGIKFIPPSAEEGLTSGRVEFSITNRSVFNFWNVPLQVILFRGNKIVTMTEVHIEPLRAGETKTVDVRVPETESVTRVQVYPDINIFDVTVYRPQGS